MSSVWTGGAVFGFCSTGRFFGSGVLNAGFFVGLTSFSLPDLPPGAFGDSGEVSILMVGTVAIANGVIVSTSIFRSSVSGVSVKSIVAGDTADGVDGSTVS